LTEVEKLKIEVVNLQYELQAEKLKSAQLTNAYGQCMATVLKDNSAVARSITTLKQEIEKNHEGFDFDIQTGTLVKKKK
jgi:K+/H+ antiporter YhaU regulatory subunit KhtT